MKHAFDATRGCLGHHRTSIRFRVARVDHHWLPDLLGKREVFGEGSTLLNSW